MFDEETRNAIHQAATESGIEPAALMAVAEIESAGRSFTVIAGRREPLIRFEGHYFDRRLSGSSRDEARRQGLASPRAGAVANPASQAARWSLLERAAAIDRKAAFESVSWGLGQVMGAHWAWLGYSGVEALAADCRTGPLGQARLMARYIVRAELKPALARRDWAAFAHGYNGPGYRANRYDTRLAAAFDRHAGAGVAPTNPVRLLREGSRGEEVVALQRLLNAAGFPVQTDGTFGPLTRQAVIRFQKAMGLARDGIAGPLTIAALQDEVENSHPLALLGRWLGGLWRRLLQ